jgi:hypothetical protein
VGLGGISCVVIVIFLGEGMSTGSDAIVDHSGLLGGIDGQFTDEAGEASVFSGGSPSALNSFRHQTIPP